MTINEFIRRLQYISRNWLLVDGCIASDDELCPIHEVWLATDDGYEHGLLENGYMEEARRLGLSTRVARQIVAAADKRGAPKLRKRLLAALGLDW